MSLSVTYAVPPPSLRSLVTLIYVLRWPHGIGYDVVNSLLGQMHWLLEGEFAYDDAAGAMRSLPRTALVGMTTRCTAFRMRGPVTLVGAGLLPRGWQQLVGVPAHESIDAIWPAERIVPHLAGKASAMDPALPDDTLNAMAIAALEGALGPDAIDGRLGEQIDRWLISDARDVGHLVERLDMSHRQLNRVVLQSHGVPLRLLGAKFRTLRCAGRLASGEAAHWSEAMTDEFCDQPQLIHNFRRFIGSTPRTFLSGSGALNREIMRIRMTMRSDNPLAGWG